jgi:ATP-dependent Clp protease ATP-binding subunit ClpC
VDLIDDPAWEWLSTVARDLHPVDGAPPKAATWRREDEGHALVRELDRGRSVLLVGQPRVGKTSVVWAATQHLSDEAPRTRRIFEISTSRVLSGTKYLGEWQTRLERILSAAEDGAFALWFTDIENLTTAGRTENDNLAMFDTVRPWVESGRVRLIGEITPLARLRLERVQGFLDAFVHQAVEPLAPDAVDDVVRHAADATGLRLDAGARKSLVSLTSRFLSSRPQPAPALDLLARVKDYQDQKAGIEEFEDATPAFIERVFSIYTGIPRFVVSRSETRSATEIRAWFEERLVGQREAIEAVLQAVALFKAGLNDPKRPLGTFLFVGPTGVGKTELARALATFLFGSPHRMLRFDLGEYKDWSSFQRLLGDPHRPSEPALLADPVKAQPFQVVLFDELEKAHPNVFDVLLGALDEGRVSTPRGEVIDLRSTFLICTSNVGAHEAGKAVGFGGANDGARRRQSMLSALEAQFRPELLNRFQHIVPFHPLDAAQIRRIVQHDLRDILQREGITGRNLVVEVDDSAIELVVRDGFDPRWGARGLKRELQRRVVTPLAMTMMEHGLVAGQILKVTGVDGHVRVRQLDTEASHEVRREHAPIEIGGRVASREDLKQGGRQLREDLEALVLALDVPSLQAAAQALHDRREDPSFWQDNERAAKEVRDLDRLTVILERVDRFHTRLTDYDADLGRADTRMRLLALARRLEELRDAAVANWRELVWMGPDGVWDALVEVRPLAAGRLARDTVTRIYTQWAEHRNMEVLWLHDPVGDDESAWFAVRGRHAHGMLRLEAGIHRVREGDDAATARVRVAPWTDRTAPVVFGDHRALKAIGTYGGRIRSRLACDGGMVLQNGNTLAENRHLAVEIAGAWLEAPAPSDVIVRRYDLRAPLVRDVLTGVSSGRPDAVSPPRFDELLCQRIGVDAQGPDAA